MASKLSYINTNSALREAEGLASRVLYADQSRGSSSAPTIRHDHFHWGYSSWGYFPQPIYCYGPSDVRGRFEKKDYSWVAIPATIIALGTLYFIGQNHADWLQAKGEIEQLRQTNRAVRIELSQENPVLKSTVLSIFQKQMGILEALQKNAINGLLLKGILLISVILAGVGGLASGGILFTAGLEPFLEYGSITAFIAVAAMLYRSGFSSMDTSIQGKAKELLIAVERAEQILYPRRLETLNLDLLRLCQIDPSPHPSLQGRDFVVRTAALRFDFVSPSPI